MQADVYKPKHNPWIIAVTVTLATIMEVLDTSIANVALPHIAGSLGASLDESTWVITPYMVAKCNCATCWRLSREHHRSKTVLFGSGLTQ